MTRKEALKLFEDKKVRAIRATKPLQNVTV